VATRVVSWPEDGDDGKVVLRGRRSEPTPNGRIGQRDQRERSIDSPQNPATNRNDN